ncbi:hypothetical protein [Pseudoalteromonas rubra]|uniref:Uncharacterized protein n=1 Tax=Pseudoalteromonas rubra TaxID=43658 RepID=A0A0F4QH99_9GAMM|nr:hypothetical protein [Pseudoalteromonas rubra]KJZ07078.1 hypothetical protein TW77_16465 [Pseudoalteromonas rubra]
MKLYVKNPSTGEKIYLKQTALTRQELAAQLGAYKFSVDGQIFSVSDVLAESSENTASAMAAGGVIGVVGGVPGVILGGLIGALLGKGSDDEDKVQSENFNRSR